MLSKDFERLLEALLPFAEKMLRESGEFCPFAAALDAEGAVGPVDADTNEELDADGVIALLLGSLRERAAAGTIRAAGICLDVMADAPDRSEQTAAILAQLEHQSGEVAEIFIPYDRGPDGELQVGEPYGQGGRRTIFGTEPWN